MYLVWVRSDILDSVRRMNSMVLLGQSQVSENSSNRSARARSDKRVVGLERIYKPDVSHATSQGNHTFAQYTSEESYGPGVFHHMHETPFQEHT